MLKVVERADADRFAPVAMTADATSVLEPIAFVETQAARRISDAAAARLIMVVAPPGYGKTTLLRAAEREARRRGETTHWRDQEDQGALGRDLETGAPAHVAFLDNAHEADHRALARMLRAVANADSGPRYVVASRTLPALDWMSLQMTGRALLLELPDLTLDLAEVEAMLTLYGGGSPTSDVVRRISGQTEGWPIAVQLCGMILRKSANALPTGAVRPSADLGRYLQSAFHDGLSPEMRGFFRDIALLDKFSGPMLAAVFSARHVPLMAAAVRENLMVVPAEGREGTFRLHSLYRQFLLQWTIVDLNDADILRRSSQWCLGNGRTDDAIEYALRAQDHDVAQQIMLSNADDIVHRTGELPRILEWVRQLEAAGAAVAPKLRLWKTWSLIFKLRLDDARRELDGFSGSLDNPQDQAHFERLQISLAARSDDAATVIARCGEWLERWRDREPFHAAAVAVLQSLAHFQRFEEAPQARAMMIARECALQSDSEYARAWVLAVEGLVELEHGRPELAREIVDRGLASETSAGRTTSPIAGTLTLVAARIALESGRHDQARAYLSHGYSSMAIHGLIETHLAGFETQVRTTEIKSGPDAALAEIHAGARKGRRFEVCSRLMMVQVMLRARRLKEARATFDVDFKLGAAGYGDTATGRLLPAEHQPAVTHTEVWLLFAEGRLDEADSLVQAAIRHADAHRRRARHISLLLAKTAIDHRQGDRAYLGILRRALAFGADGQVMLPFIDAAWAIAPALAEFSAAAPGKSEFLQAVMSELGMTAVAPGADVGMREALTAREAEVLAMLDSGLPAKRIAMTLALSLATTKWHIRNIYGKLGAHNRTGALAQARAFAII